MAATPRNAAIGVANFSALCASRGNSMQELGAAGNAEAMVIGERFAKADGHANTKPSTTDMRQNGGKTRKGRKPFVEESNVTENPLAALLKQKTYRCKKRLSRTTPLPDLFRPGNRAFAKAGAKTVKRWRRQQNSGQRLRSRQRRQRGCSRRKKRPSSSVFLRARLLSGVRKDVVLRS